MPIRVPHQRAGQASPAAVASSPAAAPAAPAWLPVAATADAYPLAQGPSYRVTASVSKNFSKSDVATYLTGHGWSTVALYDAAAGDATPADWPAGEQLGTLEDNHRWLRGEGVHSGAPTSIDQVSTLHAIFSIPLSIYRIADAWQLVPAPDPAAPPIIIGPGAGPLGLDVGIPQPIGASVYYAWEDETNPVKLEQLGATMRQGGYPIAADVLDQRALEVEGSQQATAQTAASSRNAVAIAGGVASLAIGILGALRHH